MQMQFSKTQGDFDQLLEVPAMLITRNSQDFYARDFGSPGDLPFNSSARSE
jgi:hypothetical protein